MLARRKLTYCATLPIVLAVAAWLMPLLRSGALRTAAASAIARYYDGSIELDSVRFRWRGGAVLKGLRLHQSPDPLSPVVCEVPRVELKASLLDCLAGRFEPTAVRIRKPRLVVRTASDGSWSLDLPVRWHEAADPQRVVPIHVEEARLELLAPDGPPRDQTTQQPQLQGITFAATPGADRHEIAIVGKIDDPAWGRWDVSGRFVRPDNHLHLRLRTPSLDLQRLQIGWVSPEAQQVLQRLKPSGTAAVDAEITLRPGTDEPPEYQILLDPEHVALEIPGVQETIRDVAGRIEITPDQMRVHGLVGRLRGGDVRAAGTIARGETPVFDLSVDLRRVPVEQLARPLLGERPSGLESLTGSLNLQGSADPKSWSGAFDGSLTRRDPAGAEPIAIHAAVRDGVLHVDDLLLEWGEGRIEAAVRVPLHDGSSADGTLRVHHVELGELWPLFGKQSFAVRGSLDGELQFVAPTRTWTDSTQWRWAGPVRLSDPRFGDVEFAHLDGTLACDEQFLTLRDATATLEGVQLHGTVQIARQPPYRIDAPFRADSIDLSQPATATGPQPLEVRGRLAPTGSLTGSLDPPDVTLRGSARLRGLAVAGRDLGETSLSYRLNGSGFDFDATDLRALGGRLRARGRWSWPTDRSFGGQVQSSQLELQGECDGIDLKELSATLGSRPKLAGRANGRFTLALPLGDAGAARSTRLSGRLEAAHLWAGTVVARDAAVDFVWSPDRLSVPRWSASISAGTVSGSAKLDTAGGRRDMTAQVTGGDLDLAKLVTELAGGQPPLTLRGRAAATATLRIDLVSGAVTGTGNALFKPLVIDGLPPIDSVAAQLEVHDRRLVLSDFHAAVWGGCARGSATLDFSERPAQLVHVLLDEVARVELGRLIDSWPMFRGRVRGRLSGHGEFHVPGDAPAPGIVGSGDFQLHSGVLAGLAVQLAEGTVKAWDAASSDNAAGRPPPGRARNMDRVAQQKVLIKVDRARAARGSANGHLLISVAEPTSYDSHFEFAGLDLTTVARAVFSSPHQVTGNISGDVQLHGTERGAADTWGTMQLRIRDADLWPYPVFAVIAKVLNLNLSKSGAFRSGEGEATLKNGSLHFQDVRLEGDAVQLAGQGTVGLDGQIKMEVVGHVETGIPKNMPVLGPLSQAFSYLQQRLVKVHLSGTLADPEAVPVPLQDLSEPALKFFKGFLSGPRRGSEPTSPRNGRP
jgi:hypothetical protein